MPVAPSRLEQHCDLTNLPSPADKIAADFVSKLLLIKPDFIEGIYLTGSLILNDFYSNKSDIDFIIVCKELPDVQIAKELKRLHKSISRRCSKPDLSGSYLTLDSLQTDKPEEIKTLAYHEGEMRYATFDMSVVSLSELKHNALTVWGRERETLPIDIEEKQLHTFLQKNINSYWTTFIRSFKQRLLLFVIPRLTEWSVLGVARQLCTLETNKIVSKTDAGLYCLQYLPEKFHPIIKEAIAVRKDNRSYPFVKSYRIKPSFKRMTQTIECVNYMISLFNRIYQDKYSSVETINP